MIYTIIFIAFLIGVIFIVDVLGEKKPKTSQELKSAIYNEVIKIEAPYDFDKGINIQSITNIETNGWYVADCGEYYNIVAFSKNNIAKTSTAAKKMLEKWDYSEYIKDVSKRLNDGTKINMLIDTTRNQAELKFPENQDKNLVYICKLKTNGVLIIKRQFTDRETNILKNKEDQYIHQKEYSLGYDITLNSFIRLEND